VSANDYGCDCGSGTTSVTCSGSGFYSVSGRAEARHSASAGTTSATASVIATFPSPAHPYLYPSRLGRLRHHAHTPFPSPSDSAPPPPRSVGDNTLPALDPDAPMPLRLPLQSSVFAAGRHIPVMEDKSRPGAAVTSGGRGVVLILILILILIRGRRVCCSPLCLCSCSPGGRASRIRPIPRAP